MNARNLSAVSRHLIGLGRGWSGVPALLLTLLPAPAFGQANYTPYTFTTLAGAATVGCDDGPGSIARFYNPTGGAVDASGNFYLADSWNHTVRKITPDGVVTTLAGNAGFVGSDDGRGRTARFWSPHDVAVDATGNVYVADTDNCTIRKILPDGTVTTLASRAALFDYPYGITVDAAGNIYVANHGIRRITPTGDVTTLTGLTETDGSAANIGPVWDVAVDAQGVLYVTESTNNVVRRITPSGVVTTLAGSAGFSGSADGTGSAARFDSPRGIAVDATGNVYVADTVNRTVRRITPDGVVTTLAGSAGSRGNSDGTGSAARFDWPEGLAVDASGVIHVTDTGNQTIRRVTGDGTVTTAAGLTRYPTSLDGAGAGARFSQPNGVAVDAEGSIYVADTDNHTIRKTTPGGVVTTLAGLAGIAGNTDGTGTAARFYAPYGIAVDAAGDIYVSDAGNSSVRKIAPTGMVSTLARLPSSSINPFWYNYTGLAVDASGNVYVTESVYHTIYKITSEGAVSVVANPTGGWFMPEGIAADATGSLYVTSAGNNAIFRITPSRTVTIVAGYSFSSGNKDGPGNAARFRQPNGITVDRTGSIYLTDAGNSTIRKIAPDGMVTTLAGLAESYGSADGPGSVARFYRPHGIAVDLSGNLYVADSINNAIRKGVLSDTSINVLLSVGADSWGQLGDGTGADHSTAPVQVATGVQAVAAGFSHSLFVKTDGTLWAMGWNGYGQLGDGMTNDRFSPVQVASGVQTVAAGYSHSLFVKNDGTLWAMGWNGYGQLGDGTTNDRFSPVQVASGVQAVAAGYYHSLFVKTDGTLWAMGDNSYGQLGTSTTNPRVPVQVATGVQAVIGGQYHSLFVTNDGTLWAMGENLEGQLGDGTTTDRRTPVQVADRVRAVAAGALHSLFVKSDGTLWAMGANGGQLGDGTTIYRSAPVQVATGVRTIAASYGHSLFITTNGTLWAMGSNGYGELGDGTTVTRLSPVQIAPSVQSIAAGGHHSLFVVSGDSGLAPPLITTQPTSQTMAAGHNAIFTVTASGNPAPSYQWQRLPAGSTAWQNLNEGGSYRGTTSATLTVSSPTVAMSGDQFRCVINGSTGLVATNAVALTVTGAANALLQYPAGIAMDSSANLFVADASSNTICKITPAGLVSTLAGLAGVAGSQDGTGSRARFNQPNGLASDAAGNLYVADTGNATIRKITPAGAVSTLAGSATSRGSQDGTGSAASFSSPTGIAVDAVGNLYVADAMNATIRKITSAGIVSTLAGLATVRGDADGTREAARFNYPNGLAVDAVSNLYVADTYNDTIRKVGPNGTVTTVAGSAGITGATDLTGSNALFNQPCGITLNATGNVWVADTGNGTIRRVTSGGVVTTLAGVAGIAGLGDGAGSVALFNQPRSLVVDGSGNIYVTDTGNAVIRRMAPNNSVTTLALTAAPTEDTPPPPAGGTTTPSPATGTGSASSGGGAMESWFVVMLILFGTARWSQVSSGRWHSWERGG